jgi:hypothetical protein
VTSRAPSSGESPAACPFVAFEDDRDRRASVPDRRNRCYAESVPQPRAITHQAAYCLSSSFSGCPTFLVWAAHAAAQPSATLAAAHAAAVAVDAGGVPGPAERPATDAPRGADASAARPGARDATDGPGRAADGPEHLADDPDGLAPLLDVTWGGGRPIADSSDWVPTTAWAGLVPAATGAGLDGDHETGRGPEADVDPQGVPPGEPWAAHADARDAEASAPDAPPDGAHARRAARLGAPPWAPAVPTGADDAVDDEVGARWQATPRTIPAARLAALPLRRRRPPQPPLRAIGSGEWETGPPPRREPLLRRRPVGTQVGLLLGVLVLLGLALAAFALPVLLGGAGGDPGGRVGPAVGDVDLDPGTDDPAVAPDGSAEGTPDGLLDDAPPAPWEEPEAGDADLIHATPTDDPGAEAEATPAPRPQGRPYRVRRGDTLSGIAARFRVSTELLGCVNGIGDPNVLSIGQRLIIPPRNARCPSADD